LNSSEREDIQTMDRQVFRAVVLRRNGTKNRVKSKWTVLSRIVAAAQFRRFGLGTLAYDFSRFVSWPQLDRFEGLGKNRPFTRREKNAA